MNKVLMFFGGFLVSYFVVIYHISNMGLSQTSILVGVILVASYIAHSYYCAYTVKNNKKLLNTENEYWYNNIEKEYKKFDVIDNRLVNPIYSHQAKDLISQRNNCFNELVTKFMWGYKKDI